MRSFHTVQRPANVSPAEAQFHLHASTLLVDRQFLRSRKGSVNASPSMARFPTSSANHFANASPKESRFRMHSIQSMQRPAKVSPAAAQFHLHRSLLSVLLCQPQSNSSTNCNNAEHQVLFVPDKVVMSKISSFVLYINKRKLNQNEAGEFLVHFPDKGKIRDLKGHDNSDRRFHNDEKRLKDFDFNAAYDKSTTTDPTMEISENSIDDCSTLRLAAPSLPAANTQLFVACKFANRCLEAVRKFETFIFNDFNFFNDLLQGKRVRHDFNQFLKNIQFSVNKLSDYLVELPSKHGTIASNTVTKIFCTTWNFVNWLLHFVVKVSRVKAEMPSQIASTTTSSLCQNHFARINRLYSHAMEPVKATKNVQASPFFLESFITPNKMQTIFCLEMSNQSEMIQFSLKFIKVCIYVILSSLGLIRCSKLLRIKYLAIRLVIWKPRALPECVPWRKKLSVIA